MVLEDRMGRAADSSARVRRMAAALLVLPATKGAEAVVLAAEDLAGVVLAAAAAVGAEPEQADHKGGAAKWRAPNLAMDAGGSSKSAGKHHSPCKTRLSMPSHSR